MAKVKAKAISAFCPTDVLNGEMDAVVWYVRLKKRKLTIKTKPLAEYKAQHCERLFAEEHMMCDNDVTETKFRVKRVVGLFQRGEVMIATE